MTANEHPPVYQDEFDDLLLEQRLTEAHRLLLDNADWDLPRYDHLRCCYFIANVRRFLLMHPEEIVSGGGSLGQGGNSEVYNIKVIHELLKKAEVDKDKYGPVESRFAAIDFGIERNFRAY